MYARPTMFDVFDWVVVIYKGGSMLLGYEGRDGFGM